MTPRNGITLVVSLFLLASALPAVAQSIRYVDDDASAGGNGLTWETAYRYLQDALFEASGGPAISEIHVAGGTYKPDQDEAGQVAPGDREATLQLLNGVAIMGGYRGCPGGDCGGGDLDERNIVAYETILSGDLAGDDGPDFANYDDNSYRVTVGSGCTPTAFFDGVIVSSGNANGSFPHDRGGGMYNFSGSPTVINCTFMRNRDESDGSGGGGMYNGNASSPTVTNCTFSGNSSLGRGGGVFNISNSSPAMTNCTFSGNWAYEGAGMYNGNASSPTVTSCAFTGNSADCGGGMQNYVSSPTVTNCTFRGNSAFEGGGMFNGSLGYNATVVNCAFSGNSAELLGGGMVNVGGSPTVTNCTFSGNSSGWYGGGMDNSGSSPSVTNCTFSGNSAAEYGGAMRSVDDSYLTVANCIMWGDLP